MRPAARIETARMVLRPWEPRDADALHAALDASRAALERWTPWVLADSDSLDALRDKLRKYAYNFSAGAEWRYAMIARVDERILGGASLHPRIGPGAIEIGYWVATPETGQGFATEAAEALTAEALRSVDIERIEIRCDPANEASIRVPQRLGYRVTPALVHEPPTPGRAGGTVVVWERVVERM